MLGVGCATDLEDVTMYEDVDRIYLATIAGGVERHEEGVVDGIVRCGEKAGRSVWRR